MPCRKRHVVGTIVVILLAVVAALVVVPVQRDMTLRDLITTRLAVARDVSDRLLAYRMANGTWPTHAGEYSVAGVDAAPDGRVRVVFHEPGPLRGKWAELRTYHENGRFYRLCRAPGVRDARLPAWCRSDALARELPASGGPTAPAR